MRLRQRLDSSLVAKQFVKFCIVGVLNTAVDFAVYIILARGLLGFRLHYLLANIIAFSLAVMNSYTLNRRWTFRNQDTKRTIQFTKFLSVNMVSLLLYEGLLALFVEAVGIDDIVAKALSYGLVLAWNFTAYKYWTFRERPSIL